MVLQHLDVLDWIVIGLYFIVLGSVAVWSILQKQKNTSDYFLAGRNVGWFIVGASIFASNIGSEHVVGLAGAGAGDKMPMLIYELHAWIVLMLGWVFLPFYARAGVFTMPEFLEKRYSAEARWILSVFSLLAYVMTKVSVTIYAGGVVVSSLLNINFWVGALATVVLTGIYTVLGGMKTVLYTEAVQTVILILGAGILTIIGLQTVGGWTAMKTQIGPEYFNMWRPATDPDFPWPSLFFTSTIVGIWYWCTDQYIVQRTLAARNIKEGRRGTIFGAFLKLLPVFLFLIPGIVALALKQQGKLHWDTPDQAFPVLMSNLLPSGLRGLVAAGLLAALMSSLASVFNSCSTLFTVDIYRKLKPHASERHLVKVGRVATGIVVVLGILWIPVMSNISGVLYEYLQSVQSYIAPPITAVFLLGIFSRRINSAGALITLVFGFFVAGLRIVLELFKNQLSPGSIWHGLGSMNFLTFGAFFFLACVIVAIAVSLLTEATPRAKLSGLTFSTLTEEQKIANRVSYNWIDVLGSALIVLVVIFIMLYFSG